MYFRIPTDSLQTSAEKRSLSVAPFEVPELTVYLKFRCLTTGKRSVPDVIPAWLLKENANHLAGSVTFRGGRLIHLGKLSI